MCIQQALLPLQRSIDRRFCREGVPFWWWRAQAPLVTGRALGLQLSTRAHPCAVEVTDRLEELSGIHMMEQESAALLFFLGLPPPLPELLAEEGRRWLGSTCCCCWEHRCCSTAARRCCSASCCCRAARARWRSRSCRTRSSSSACSCIASARSASCVSPPAQRSKGQGAHRNVGLAGAVTPAESTAAPARAAPWKTKPTSWRGNGKGRGVWCRWPSQPFPAGQRTCRCCRRSCIPAILLCGSLRCCGLLMCCVRPEGLKIAPHQLCVAIHGDQVLPADVCGNRAEQQAQALGAVAKRACRRGTRQHVAPCPHNPGWPRCSRLKLTHPLGPLHCPAHRSHTGSPRRWPGCRAGRRAP